MRQSVSQSVGGDENENGMFSCYGNIGGEVGEAVDHTPPFLTGKRGGGGKRAAECSETMHLSTISVRSKIIRRWSTGGVCRGEGGPMNSASPRKIAAVVSSDSAITDREAEKRLHTLDIKSALSRGDCDHCRQGRAGI